MPTDRDYEAARIAVEQGLLGRDQADQLLADLRTAEAFGTRQPFCELAVKRGLLSEADRRTVEGRAERARQPVIPGFELLERIGRGGMGTVYKARQLSFGRIVALKILSRRLAQSRPYVQRFLREARAAARLNHPHIVQGIDVGKAGGDYFFVMEYVNGESAAEKMERTGPFPEKEAVAIAAQIARALQHAHAANIIHRDVKPQNILLDAHGSAKLADLGLAREAARADAAVTTTGTTLGTPDYISPEQIRGETDLDGRCDIYSLGATLYHLLTGKPPFRGETGSVTMARHLTEPVPDPAAERPGLSAEAAAIVRRAMQKDRKDRYQTAEEMADALDACLRRLSAAEKEARSVVAARPRPRTPIPSSRSAVAVILVASTLAAALGIAALGFLSPPATPPPPGSSGIRSSTGEPDADPTPAPREMRPGEKAHEYAQQKARELENEPWILLRVLKDPILECAGTEYESAVLVLRDNARRKLREMAEKDLAARVDEADRLCDAGRYGEALRTLRMFPDYYLRFREWKARLEEAEKAVEERAKTAYDRLVQSARRIARTGDFDGAIQAMERVAPWGVPSLDRSARRLIEKWRAEKARRELEELQAKLERFRLRIGIMTRIRAALKKRDYETALRVAAEAARNDQLGSERREFDLLARDIRRIQWLWREAERRLRALRPGDKIRLHTILVDFIQFKNGIITAQATRPTPLLDLRDVDLFHLLQPVFRQADPKDPEPYLRRGLFYTFDKYAKIEQALKDFRAAEERGAVADAARGRAYIAQLGRLEPEYAAVQLLAEVRLAAEAKNWPRVTAKLRELIPLRNTQTCRRSRTEITEWMLRAAGRGRGLASLFSGRVRLRGADRVTVEYDLRNEKHREDWRGGAPSPRGLRCRRPLRWNAGIDVRSVTLVFRFERPEDIGRTELLVMCTPQGAHPRATAGFGVIGGRRCYLVGRGFRQVAVRILPRTDTTLEVALEADRARLRIGGKDVADVRIAGGAAGRFIILRPERAVLDVVRVVVAGRLDLDWARQRAADLADLAESKLLATVPVPADRPWTPTGLVLHSGRHYHLRARGWWRYGRDGVGPAGEPRLLDGLPLFALVARIGGETYYVGEEMFLGPDADGRLFLGMNEVPGGHRDNSGSLRVEIRELPRRTDTRGELAPGVLAACYAGTNFEAFVRAQIRPSVFSDERGLEKLAGRTENFSIRWEGFLKIDRRGPYEFGVVADDGFRLFLDGRRVLERWRSDDRARARSGPVFLEKGLHKITLEYFQTLGPANLSLWWRRPGERGQPVPSDVFFHSVDRARELGVRP